ncbi:MAG: ATP-binding protein [Cyclobacteriaceae bacterium]|nr:ATP-binding protein [Cyclobacteriaceae bacterium]
MKRNIALGRVIGTEDSTPLEFWVAISNHQFVQLDEVVALERELPDGRKVRIYGMVTQIRARHEGARFDSDVFLIENGILPAEVSQAAKITTTRFEPEIFVPPIPGQLVNIARENQRDEALFFDQMERKLAIGLSRDDEVFYLNFDFLNGTRGAHVNISGVSGVATKTTYASFLLYSLFHSGILGNDSINTKAIIYNVKGEDLLFLDHTNSNIKNEQRTKYSKLGLTPGAFESVEFWAPPRRDDPNVVPDVTSRQKGVSSFFWTIAEFCKRDFLTFLFADAEDDRQQYTIVIQNVIARLREATSLGTGGVRLDGVEVRMFNDLVELIVSRLRDTDTQTAWAGPAIGQGTINAFVRRLYSAAPHVGHLIRGDVSKPEKHVIKNEAQVSVVDIHNLNDRAKRFVVGITLKKLFDEKEKSGQANPLLFVVLDELNKYAPREGSSPIKEILVDVAERGRSLGIILVGAQQTASEIERRIVANSAIRIVGRLDSAEAGHAEYGFLPVAHRQRATILKPGTMILAQPELPIPLVLEFPFPSWATRATEASEEKSKSRSKLKTDPFAGLKN